MKTFFVEPDNMHDDVLFVLRSFVGKREPVASKKPGHVSAILEI